MLIIGLVLCMFECVCVRACLRKRHKRLLSEIKPAGTEKKIKHHELKSHRHINVCCTHVDANKRANLSFLERL